MNEPKPVGKIYLITDIPECEWYQPVTEGDLLYAIPDTHRVVSVELLKDAERYAWLKSHVGEQRTQRSLMNEFSENKTEYVFPRLIAWADFCGQITLDEAIDLKIAAIAEKQAIIDNKEQKE